MARIARLLLALAALTAICVAEKPSDLKHHGTANDFAQVLSAEQKQQLDQLGEQVWTEYHAKISVVTVKSLDGETVEAFANMLFKQWGVGGKDDRGVLILLAVNDRKYRVEVGYGLEPILPDGKVGQFGREAVPFLKKQQYGNAVAQIATRVAETIAADANGNATAAGETIDAASADIPPTYVDERNPALRAWDWIVESPIHLFISGVIGVLFLIVGRAIYLSARGAVKAANVTVNVPEGKDPKKQIPIWFLVGPVFAFFALNFILSMLELSHPMLWFGVFITLVVGWIFTLRRMMKNGWWLPKSGSAGGSSWDSDSSSSSSSWGSSSSSSDSGYDGGSSGGGGASGSW